MTKRRNFIKQLGAAGILTSLAPVKALAETAERLETADAARVKPQDGLVTILQSTDVHCQMHPHDEMYWENGKAVFRKSGGYAHMATAFDYYRKRNPDTFIIDTGDMFQGSELSVKTTGKAIAPVLNDLGYNLYLPGNWEVIYYKDNMQKLMGGLDAPKVCANMYHDLGNGQKGELIFPPYHTWFAKGIKIGFLGYTDPLVPVRQSPAYSKGIIYTKPEENIKHYVDVLRSQEQCDLVIILSHLGLSQQIALGNSPECEGVDYIFGGDTHERIRKPIVCKYTKVVEPGAFGSFIGKLDLEVKDGKIIKQDYELVEVSPKRFKADKKISALIAEEEKPFKEAMSKVLGHSTIPLYRYFVIENTIDTLITDALMWKVGTDVVLSNGFRFCPPLVPDSSGKAAITEGYLYDMLPVNSTVRTGKVTGKQILDWLEKELNNVFAKDASKRLGGWVIRPKGLDFEFFAFNEFGKRVKSARIGGKEIDPEKVYTMCACEREGDPPTTLCRMQNVMESENTPYTLHSTMKDYLAANSPVTPSARGNVKVLDASQQLLTQVYGVDYEFR
jgi:2',3'-cyclic-nucleotide 2'-phosphodiesterase (5'-nucleotidase family)